MNVPINDPTLHFGATFGTVLPADYLNPPDDPNGIPTLDATLFRPLTPNHSAIEADKLHVHRMAKGEQWVVVDETFGTDRA